MSNNTCLRYRDAVSTKRHETLGRVGFDAHASSRVILELFMLLVLHRPENQGPVASKSHSENVASGALRRLPLFVTKYGAEGKKERTVTPGRHRKCHHRVGSATLIRYSIAVLGHSSSKRNVNLQALVDSAVCQCSSRSRVSTDLVVAVIRKRERRVL